MTNANPSRSRAAFEPASLMLREAWLAANGKAPGADTLAASAARLQLRQAWQPQLAPDADALPIDAHRETIIDALQREQVIVVSGETGSGKTTQLPRFALAAGFGRRGMIGHTQPRRIAARSVAARIAEQCATTLGEGVGYAVRFDDRSAPQTLVRLMTDGILLNEIQHDRLLLGYEVLIIDEAHERSLNIDFLIGYLKEILPRRPDLRVIITSATIDHERFASHFDGAPVLEVSGRGYPVEVVHDERAPAGDDSRAIARRVCDAVRDLQGRRLPDAAPDLLVFLPGEREIRDSERALQKSGLVNAAGWEVLPLFGRLSDRDQSRVFEPGARRRIVLATNVAETSLTVPRIGAVIDSGLARISRYSHRSRVQRLQLEPISQASANQRAGRCGRIGPGICLRLYSAADFDARSAFTDAEILRTNLASVVLQSAALGLGDVQSFPFIDPPEAGQIDDARRLLTELGALDPVRGGITRRGRELARLPLDPRLASMLRAGDADTVLAAVIVVVAALSIQDPRQRPLEHAAAADAAQAPYRDQRSDFLSLLNLWRAIEHQRGASGRRAFERWCAAQFLSPRRVREWREVARQLARQLGAQGKLDAAAAPLDEKGRVALHRAVLSGLLSQVGVREADGEYLGCGKRRFLIHPSSALHGGKTKWLMALEIVQTHKRFARYAAAIELDWLLSLARPLLDYEYEPPTWNARRGRVEAQRTSLLYDLVVRANERVNYVNVDRAATRAVFIREGLVADRVRLRAAFIEHNRRTLAELDTLAGKLRRPLEISAAAMAALYDERLPAAVVDLASLKKWLKRAPPRAQQRLCFDAAELQGEAGDLEPAKTPTALAAAGNTLAIDYTFQPARREDGASVRVPAALLPSMSVADVDAAVPGFLTERVLLRLKRLPKPDRKRLHPLAQSAAALADALIVDRSPGDLDARLGRLLLSAHGIADAAEAWQGLDEPRHLRPRIVVVDDRGRELQASRDLQRLRETMVDTGVPDAAPAVPRATPQRDWQFGTLPHTEQVQQGGLTLQRYPALQVQGKGVIVTHFAAAAAAAAAHRDAVVKLLSLRFAQQVKALRKALVARRDIQLLWAAFDDPGAAALVDDLPRAALLHTFGARLEEVRSAAAFTTLCAAGAAALMDTGHALLETLHECLQAHADVRQRLAAAPPHWQEACADITQQIADLVYPGFLSATPVDRLADVPRYLHAAALRLQRLASNVARDTASMAMIQSLEARVAAVPAGSSSAGQAAAIEAFRWQLQELRVSLFAQTLGTREKVSVKRLEKAWHEILTLPH